MALCDRLSAERGVKADTSMMSRFFPLTNAQSVLNFQPIVPFHLNDDWNLITRWVRRSSISLDLRPTSGPSSGLAVCSRSSISGPPTRASSSGAWVPRPICDATDKTLGVNAWGVGPGVVVLTIPRPWLIGVLVNNVWAWQDGQKVDQMTIQYFINYNLPQGWYLVSQPIITSDWRAPLTR